MNAPMPERVVFVRFYCAECAKNKDVQSDKPFDEPLPEGWVGVTIKDTRDEKRSFIFCSNVCASDALGRFS